MENIPADLVLDGLQPASHVVIGPRGREHLLLRRSDKVLTVRLAGNRACIGPVRATFLVGGIPAARAASSALIDLVDLAKPADTRPQPKHLRRRLLLRDALAALDGRLNGATYQQTATIIYGAQRAKAEWSSRSRALKERMRRALDKGEALRDGGYVDLSTRGVVS